MRNGSVFSVLSRQRPQSRTPLSIGKDRNTFLDDRGGSAHRIILSVQCADHHGLVMKRTLESRNSRWLKDNPADAIFLPQQLSVAQVEVFPVFLVLCLRQPL